jgi:hypothetical protein
MLLRLTIGVLILIVLLFSLSAQSYDRKFPDRIDPAKRYMFYMHGTYVERVGPLENYHYYDILDAIAAKDIVVIGEARSLTQVGIYARTIARQVQQLLDAGVPSYQITVAGHSKGGMITMTVATLMAKPGINYVVFAGCGLPGNEYLRGYRKFVEAEAKGIEGNFLIAWPADDEIAGNCDLAMQKGKADYVNKVLPAGLGGHKIFYNANPVWLDELVNFAKGG